MTYLNFEPGDIIITNVRFSNQEDSKLRPALVISSVTYNKNSNDLVALKITSQNKGWPFDIPLTFRDIASGRLKTESVIKADFPVVIDKHTVKVKVATVKIELLQKAKQKLKEVLEL